MEKLFELDMNLGMVHTTAWVMSHAEQLMRLRALAGGESDGCESDVCDSGNGRIEPNSTEQFAGISRLRLLDAGCGNGALAKSLMNRGLTVTAIDSHPEAVAEAKAAGINAELINLMDYRNDEPFDVILLSRAFHHMQPLDKTVTQLRKLLKDDGLLLLEEFAAELVNDALATWFYGLKSFLNANCTPLKGRGPKLENGAIPGDPLDGWRKHHFGKHCVATSVEMLEALSSGFELVEEMHFPYLYKYFVDDVSSRHCEAIFEWERRICELENIVPIGLRLVARKL